MLYMYEMYSIGIAVKSFASTFLILEMEMRFISAQGHIAQPLGALFFSLTLYILHILTPYLDLQEVSGQ